MKTRVSRVICKLDVEKAYNHVNWNFLTYLLLGDVASQKNGEGGFCGIYQLSNFLL